VIDKRVDQRVVNPLPLAIEGRFLPPIAVAGFSTFRDENAIITPEWRCPEDPIPRRFYEDRNLV
jgi:hypothetical protein